MQNTIYTLQELFNNNKFQIPQYQRAYSWDTDPHLASFLDDLRQQVKAQVNNPEKQYYLGTLLLHEVTHGVLHIVDGQQRLTTAVVFIATALNLYEDRDISLDEKVAKLWRRVFIYDHDLELQRFHTILEDESFFRTVVLQLTNAANKPDTQSARRLRAAVEFFSKSVNSNEWQSLAQALVTARVMVYVVTNSADATQIFELQNDRGKRLTDLEALKSYLMHLIYLQSRNPDDYLSNLQEQFSKIFRIVEDLEQFQRAPEEDSILSYHCVAHLDWKESEWRHPKKLIKRIIQSTPSEEIVPWVEAFTANLVKSYDAVRKLFRHRDHRMPFSDLLILGRMAPFWPLVLKTWYYDSKEQKLDFDKVCRLLEVYAFRGYAMSNLRSDSGLASLYNAAKEFSGNFETLYEKLFNMSFWYNLKKRFLAGLDNKRLYKEDRTDALYLLWKYENSLRMKRGQKQPLLSWRDFVEPHSYAAKFSVEHIAAQENSIVETNVKWAEGEEGLFYEYALHRLGNLVIDSISPNAAKGKKDLAEKLIHLSNSIYLSQGELRKWVKTFNHENVPHWCVEAVKDRHTALIQFALENWDPTTYHTSSSSFAVADEPLSSSEDETRALESLSGEL